MITLYASQIKDRAAFELEIRKYIARLKASNFEVNKPRPTSDSLVEACVKRVPQGKGKPDDYQADYQIIDDLIEHSNEVH